MSDPIVEPITVEELQAIARIVPGDEELALCPGYISAARQAVEHDTDLVLVAGTYTITIDDLPTPYAGAAIPLPFPPLVSIDKVAWFDTEDAEHVVPPTSYLADVDRIPGRLVWTPPLDAPPLDGTPRSYRALAITFTGGYDAATLPPGLKWAVGMLAAHYLTTGRDLVTIGSDVARGLMPQGYQEMVDRYRVVSVG